MLAEKRLRRSAGKTNTAMLLVIAIYHRFFYLALSAPLSH
jgi:hypothetical protein